MLDEDFLLVDEDFLHELLLSDDLSHPDSLQTLGADVIAFDRAVDAAL